MLIGYLGVKLALPMRSRNVHVLRPVVELINFNLNVIKMCGFPAPTHSEGERRGSTFKFKRVRPVWLLFWVKSFLQCRSADNGFTGAMGRRPSMWHVHVPKNHHSSKMMKKQQRGFKMPFSQLCLSSDVRLRVGPV